MDRISVRGLATAIRLIREPVVVTYSYPKNHPLWGAGEECGVFVPLSLWQNWTTETDVLPVVDDGIRVNEPTSDSEIGVLHESPLGR